MPTSSKPLVITGPYEHLLCGTMELRIRNRKTYYFTPVMEAYSRLIVSYTLDKDPSEKPVLESLRYAEKYLGAPAHAHLNLKATIHLTQRGASKNQAYIDFVKNSQRLLMPEEGFKRNNRMTSFFSRYTGECFNYYYSELTSFKALGAFTMDFCKYYNEERIQAGLEWHTPKEYLHIAVKKLNEEYAQSQVKAQTQAKAQA